MPSYNGGRYLPATLRSILAQQGAELEVIVVDDGSTDGTAERVACDFPQVRLVRQPNQGVSVARNRGIEAARHEWVAFIDADDIWLPGKLKMQLERLREMPAAQMVYTAWHVWTSAEENPRSDWLEGLVSGGEALSDESGPDGWIYPELLLDCHVWTSTTMARTEFLRELGGFNPELRIGEDYDLWLRASRLTPILRVDKPLALYRMHPGNATKGVPRANYKGEIVERALRQWGYAGPDGRQARRRDVDKGLARSWSDYAGAHLIGGDADIAWRAARRAVALDPSMALAWKVLVKSMLKTLPGRRRRAAP